MAAYTYAYTNHGTVLRSDGAEFPAIAGTIEYDQWQAFITAGGTTTPADSITLTDEKNAAKEVLDKLAGDQRRLFTHAGVDDDLGQALRFMESRFCQDDPTPEADNYPMLQAEIPGNGANLAAVANNVAVERLALATSLGVIETVRRATIALIDACADQGEIDAVMAAIDWTP
jgi:hypothetical protein